MNTVNNNHSSSQDILIVDDTVANLKLLANILGEAGYQVRPAGDGELALRSVQAKRPALILLDIRMPGMDGFEVCRRLKTDTSAQDIPVIFLSSLTETADKTQGLELGAVDYIAKPFEAQEVLARIRAHLALSAAKEQLKRQNILLQQANEQLTHEIAERKRAEEELRRHKEYLEETVADRTAELRKANEKYLALFMEARDGIVLIDTESGRIEDCNPEFERQSGRGLDQLRTMLIWELRYEDKIEAAREIFFKIRQEGAGGSSDLGLQQPNGVRVPVEINSKVIHLGERRYIQSISRDITERKQSEERLKAMLESLSRQVNTTIQVLVSAVETRDPYTAGHQIRSANLAQAIAAEMELPAEKIESCLMAGYIHDIGKLSIPSEILSKPTKLTEIEYSLIKEHANRGFEILKDIESSWPLAEIVRQHHERMDGSGYPMGLKGEEILIEARILAVADTVEAMASHRPYRPGLGVDAALNEIEMNSGISYDRTVAKACLRLFREKGFVLKSPDRALL